jgi:tetratricopeptide (TPR) repeat protein
MELKESPFMNWYYKYVKVNRRSANRLSYDFEISLATAVLNHNANNLGALEMLGNALTKKGKHKKALDVDKRIVEMLPKSPVAYYNLACSYSNLKQIDEALEALKKALKLGYRDIKYMMKDPDLKNLRNNPRFLEIIAEIRKKKKK